MSVTIYYVEIVLVEDGGLHLLGVEAALLVPVVAGVELGEVGDGRLDLQELAGGDVEGDTLASEASGQLVMTEQKLSYFGKVKKMSTWKVLKYFLMNFKLESPTRNKIAVLFSWQTTS